MYLLCVAPTDQAALRDAWEWGNWAALRDARTQVVSAGVSTAVSAVAVSAMVSATGSAKVIAAHQG